MERDRERERERERESPLCLLILSQDQASNTEPGSSVIKEVVLLREKRDGSSQRRVPLWLGSIAPDVNDFIIIIVVVINICLMLICSSTEDRSLSDCHAFVCFVLF